MSRVTLKDTVSAALKDKRVSANEARRIADAVTWDARENRVSATDVKLLQKVASLPDTAFEDRRAPHSVRAARDDIREYAAAFRELQAVPFEVTAKVPGVEVKLSRDLAVVDFDDFGTQHERIIEVTMKDAKAKADGRLGFAYGGFKVSVDVKAGTPREKVLERIEAALQKQQESMSSDVKQGGAVTQFLVHRFEPLTAAERRERDEALRLVDDVVSPRQD
jgi:hypothetical protein